LGRTWGVDSTISYDDAQIWPEYSHTYFLIWQSEAEPRFGVACTPWAQ
jgi:hypothetical protein